MFPLKKIFKFLTTAFNRWNEHEATSMAASLSYFAIFSIAPLLVMMLGIAGLVFDQAYVQTQILAYLAALLGAQASTLIGDLLLTQLNPTTSYFALIFGIVTLILGATGIVGQLQNILNKIWEIPGNKRSGVGYLIKSKIAAVILVFVLAVLLIVSILLSTFVSYLNSYLPLYMAVVPLSDTLLTLFFLTLFFIIVFGYLPHRKPNLLKVLPGALITAILIFLGKYAVSIYLSSSKSISAFGAASALVILLLWIYFMSLLILFGAEITRMLEERSTTPATT
ncbi:MAG: YihY/virulence factor BrkB family protein [Candidatus Gracilibacteria bacterium]